MRPQLSALAAPITVIVPWSNQGFGEERTLAFYKRQYAPVPNVSFVGVGDAGHFVMLDQPQAFAAAIEAFVK
jgi:pimeloyl-ACP methyl ester carboxylesterase